MDTVSDCVKKEMEMTTLSTGATQVNEPGVGIDAAPTEYTKAIPKRMKARKYGNPYNPKTHPKEYHKVWNQNYYAANKDRMAVRRKNKKLIKDVQKIQQALRAGKPHYPQCPKNISNR